MELHEAIEQVLGNHRISTQKDLQAVIRSLSLTPERVAPWIAKPHRLPYGRTTLYSADGLEAVLVHLPAGAETFIHDHGYSICCAVVLEGTMVNRIYRVDDYGYPVLCSEQQVSSGEFITAPKFQIHQMANPGKERMVSFHLYAPRMSAAQRYFTYEQALDFVI